MTYFQHPIRHILRLSEVKEFFWLNFTCNERVRRGQGLGYKYCITYLPHKAVAEVSKDKEPIGRERAEFNWFESQLMSDSNELRVK